LNTNFRVDLTRFKVQTNFTWIWVFELWIDLHWNFLEKNKFSYSPWTKTGRPKTQLGWWPTVRTESGEQSMSHGGSMAARRQSGEPVARAGRGSDPRAGPVVGESIWGKGGAGTYHMSCSTVAGRRAKDDAGEGLGRRLLVLMKW
jgi:hypothetical protein